MNSFLFVCTGNICRSPLAELAMKQEAKKRGLSLDIDSAAIGHWHLGYPPDPRAADVARQHGLDTTGLTARLVQPEDFDRFDHIIAMDRTHLAALTHMKPRKRKARITLMMDHLPGREGEEVADPYYGPDSGFLTTWEDVSAACHALACKELDPASGH
ncbi:low molecular weight protein-tyrosine-phosphatase [Gluconobacter morbifer]|uniref:protein-tyrosine-phosphatase n=1 Tax=Gluconobacter morbifer G707 TaxID=1088869 RepID=G6XLQ3_9PROT|nr:low molecular weight protein-tyrosine-phosphatase [Gluconobacter morbifer]EHH67308.1 phosphotyrosine protein phosphatase [Gluconobacter morbifer G707]